MDDDLLALEHNVRHPLGLATLAVLRGCGANNWGEGSQTHCLALQEVLRLWATHLRDDPLGEAAVEVPVRAFAQQFTCMLP